MAKYELKIISGISPSSDMAATGKTSLCESFLFVSGKTDRLGRVDEGTSTHGL